MGGALSAAMGMAGERASGHKQGRPQLIVAGLLAAMAAGAAAVVVGRALAPPLAADDDDLPPLALPDDCASVIAMHLRSEELANLSTSSRGTYMRYQRYIWSVSINSREAWAAQNTIVGLRSILRKLPGGAWVQDRWRDRSILAELSRALRRLPGLTCVHIYHYRTCGVNSIRIGLSAVRNTRASRQLRCIKLTKMHGSIREHTLDLILLTSMIAAGQLSALISFDVDLVRQRGCQSAYAALMSSLGHARAPLKLAILRVVFEHMDERMAVALAEALEARARRGFSALEHFAVDGWLEYPETAMRINCITLPGLWEIDYGCHNQPATDALAHALRSMPALELRKMSLRSHQDLASSDLISALRHGSFPKLLSVNFRQFYFTSVALEDLTLALQQNLRELQTLVLWQCSAHEDGEIGVIVNAFLHGGGRCLKAIHATFPRRQDAFDALLASTIDAGACPMLEYVGIAGSGVAKAALAARRAMQEEEEEEKEEEEEEEEEQRQEQQQQS